MIKVRIDILATLVMWAFPVVLAVVYSIMGEPVADTMVASVEVCFRRHYQEIVWAAVFSRVYWDKINEISNR